MDNLVYFITARGRMKATDGTRIFDKETFPRIRDADDLWDGLNTSRLSSVYGQFYQGKDFRHIYWFASNGSSTTNDIALVWDVDNQCWGQFNTGYVANVAITILDGSLKTADYGGKIHNKDVAETHTDASNSSAAIKSEWRWGWQHFGSFMKTKQIDWINVSLKSETAGNVTVRVGSDMSENLLTETISLKSVGMNWGEGLWGVDRWGGAADFIGNVISESVRGNTLQLAFEHEDPNAGIQVNGFSISGKEDGTKEFSSQ